MWVLGIELMPLGLVAAVFIMPTLSSSNVECIVELITHMMLFVSPLDLFIFLNQDLMSID